MKGRAYQLLFRFRQEYGGPEGVFLMSRLILLSRVVPERITPELDDVELESRIEESIAKIRSRQAQKA